MSEHSKLTDLMRYYKENRGVGHTTAAIEGVKNTNAVYLVAAECDRVRLGVRRENTISIGGLPKALYGIKRPLVIDHYALHHLVEEHNEWLIKETIEKRDTDIVTTLLEVFGIESVPSDVCTIEEVILYIESCVGGDEK